MDHRDSAERIKRVTKAIVKRLVLKGKLPPPRKTSELPDQAAEVVSLHKTPK